MQLNLGRVRVSKVEFEQAEGLGRWHLGDDGGRDLCVSLEGHGQYREVIESLLEMLYILKNIMLYECISTKTMLDPARYMTLLPSKVQLRLILLFITDVV